MFRMFWRVYEEFIEDKDYFYRRKWEKKEDTYIVDQHQIVHQDKSVRLHDLVLDPFGRDQTNTSLD